MDDVLAQAEIRRPHTIPECRLARLPVIIEGVVSNYYLPDANGFGGEVKVMKRGYFDPNQEWEVFSCKEENLRGIGPSVMAEAIENHSENPTDAYRAMRIIEVFESI